MKELKPRWPDMAIAAAQLSSTLALIPTIIYGPPPALTTSALTVISVLVVCISLIRLEAYRGAVGALFCALCWWILFLQGLTR